MHSGMDIAVGAYGGSARRLHDGKLARFLKDTLECALGASAALPRFPEFRKLQLSDHALLQRYTGAFAPYSDFNFACLWSWDLEGRIQVSDLNGNLVVHFANFLYGEEFYSLLGTHSVNQAAAALIDHAERQRLVPCLQLVPEIVARELDPATFSVVENADHTDYILSTERLSTYQGPAFASKRNEVRKFSRRFPQSRFTILDLANASVRDQARQLFRRWSEQKESVPGDEATREFQAFERGLAIAECLPLFAAGVFVDQVMAAISVSEIVDHANAITHFEKVDIANFPGLTAFVNQQVAGALAARGIRYINIEQDLGIAGLRTSKQSYSPCNYLRKYSVARRRQERA